ncbi:MAG: DUF2802 domain-containing protein [Sulfuritalea sp.]|nr:DUF2802 domain-containing protein [Sulfuritalea sp.]
MMDFELPGAIGWRDVVLVIAAMLGVYLVLAVMRLFRIGGKRRDSPPLEGKRDPFGAAPPASPDAGQSQPAPPVPGMEFARKLAQSNVEVELQSLRREVAVLREELARLAEEVSRLKVTRNVSPLYDEAMALAQQGMPAAGIAGHCGISIGEAELVAALARGESEFDSLQQGEDRDERNTDSGNRLHG